MPRASVGFVLVLLAAGCAVPGDGPPGARGDEIPQRMSVKDIWVEGLFVQVPAERIGPLLPEGFRPVLTPGGEESETRSRHGTLLVLGLHALASTDGNATFYSVNETWIEAPVLPPDEHRHPEFAYEKATLLVVTDHPASFAAYDAWGLEARLAPVRLSGGASTPAIVQNSTRTLAGNVSIEIDMATSAEAMEVEGGQKIRWFGAREGRLTTLLHAASPPVTLWVGEGQAKIAAGEGAFASIAGTWSGAGARQAIPGVSEWWVLPPDEWTTR